ncbi:hypothetical protein VNO78_34681 [Psophocarpus tetragonolobus]|uniref:Uncharacterized protein n=1 Tax=Psophocarpus tetragonolobus TaxID=3891 RepID=A0AAN9NNT0_PSOTE
MLHTCHCHLELCVLVLCNIVKKNKGPSRIDINADDHIGYKTITFVRGKIMSGRHKIISPNNAPTNPVRE